ncbi:STAS domain-containing protein [Streptomyces sp. NK08204]|uniref:STAS domain-containing protein n=1 Tax=Streptomyces sp. NK08204 TaxID=2873260 RepID=UPI0035A8E204
MKLSGEIDLAAAVEIRPVLGAVIELATPSVVVDLLDVDFFDCSGLRLLCRPPPDRGARWPTDTRVHASSDPAHPPGGPACGGIRRSSPPRGRS